MTALARSGDTLRERPSVDMSVALFAASILAVGALIIGVEVSVRMAALYLIGGGLGVALLHGAFGFTAGWRRIVTHGDGRGMRAQLIVIALTMLVFIPLINGVLPDLSLTGAIAPVGASLILGSFVFGLGMQLGNGCGSGTLFTLGGGSQRMLLTLVAFIAGSVVGSIHLPWWLGQVGTDPVNLAKIFTIPGAILLQAVILAAIGWWTLRRERSAGYKAETLSESPLSIRLFRGPWTFFWSGMALVVLNIATLLLAGHPWTITYGFAVWGAKFAQGIGFDMSQFEFWTWPKASTSLSNSILADVTSVMNFGLIAGAMLAAGLAGTFASPVKLSGKSAAGAIIGGLLMGYGARLAFGCNIGAFLGGIASGSLHGWVWFLFAFAGTLAGIKLRPYFGLGN